MSADALISPRELLTGISEPLGCVVRGVDRIDPEIGETAAVVGAGPIGLLRNDRIDTDALVTHEEGLTGLPDAFERMGANDGLKQMVYPGR